MAANWPENGSIPVKEKTMARPANFAAMVTDGKKLRHATVEQDRIYMRQMPQLHAGLVEDVEDRVDDVVRLSSQAVKPFERLHRQLRSQEGPDDAAVLFNRQIILEEMAFKDVWTENFMNKTAGATLSLKTPILHHRVELNFRPFGLIKKIIANQARREFVQTADIQLVRKLFDKNLKRQEFQS